MPDQIVITPTVEQIEVSGASLGPTVSPIYETITIDTDGVNVTASVDVVEVLVSPVIESPVVSSAEIEVITIAQQGPPGPPGDGTGGAAVLTSDQKNKSAVTIKSGTPVATHSSGSGVILADSAAAGHEAIGLMGLDTLSGDTNPVQLEGAFTLSDWTSIVGTASLQARAIYYLGTTPGTLTTSSPTDYPNISQQVGMAISATTLVIGIWKSIQL